jgi:uroporphyrinogen III methyltransferase / synthase
VGNKTGFVYLVGAGPGDPGLLTLRAVELLQQAEVVAYDLLIPPAILEKIPAKAEKLPVGRRHGAGKCDYRLHPDVLERARAGQVVVRLKAGDPLMFGRGGEEAEELVEAGIPFEIVPGVSAAFGAAAYAGIPLTLRHHASEVLFRTGHDSAETVVATKASGRDAVQGRTTVLYMVTRRLQRNLDQLVQEGYQPTTPVALIAGATRRHQQVIVSTIAELPGKIHNLDSDVPSLLIAGDVVRLRSKIAWFEKKQLQGSRILVARARPGASGIAKQLRDFGAEVLETPSISVAALEDYSELDGTLGRLSEFEAVVFSCSSGVEFIVQRLKARGISVPLRAIAIGDQASRALVAAGIRPCISTSGSCHEALQQTLSAFAGKELLLITSSEGRPQLQRELSLLSSSVKAVGAYLVNYRFDAIEGSVSTPDLVVLPSSSAARRLLNHERGTALRNIATVVMGPETEAAARECGATNIVRAANDSIEAIITCVLHQLSNPE